MSTTAPEVSFSFSQAVSPKLGGPANASIAYWLRKLSGDEFAECNMSDGVVEALGKLIGHNLVRRLEPGSAFELGIALAYLVMTKPLGAEDEMRVLIMRTFLSEDGKTLADFVR